MQLKSKPTGATWVEVFIAGVPGVPRTIIATPPAKANVRIPFIVPPLALSTVGTFNITVRLAAGDQAGSCKCANFSLVEYFSITAPPAPTLKSIMPERGRRKGGEALVAEVRDLGPQRGAQLTVTFNGELVELQKVI